MITRKSLRALLSEYYLALSRKVQVAIAIFHIQVEKIKIVVAQKLNSQALIKA